MTGTRSASLNILRDVLGMFSTERWFKHPRCRTRLRLGVAAQGVSDRRESTLPSPSSCLASPLPGRMASAGSSPRASWRSMHRDWRGPCSPWNRPSTSSMSSARPETIVPEAQRLRPTCHPQPRRATMDSGRRGTITEACISSTGGGLASADLGGIEMISIRDRLAAVLGLSSRRAFGHGSDGVDGTVAPGSKGLIGLTVMR